MTIKLGNIMNMYAKHFFQKAFFSILTVIFLVTCSAGFFSVYTQAADADNDNSTQQAETAADEISYVTNLYNDRNGLPTSEANVVIQTSDGYIWIGSYGGLIRYDGSYFVNYTEEADFPSSSVRALFEAEDGTLWIGTNDKGVFRSEGFGWLQMTASR